MIFITTLILWSLFSPFCSIIANACFLTGFLLARVIVKFDEFFIGMVADDMVLQRRLDYGFNGYQVPPTPRATRSARVNII